MKTTRKSRRLESGRRRERNQLATTTTGTTPFVRWLAPLLVVLVTGAVFSLSLQNGFVDFDDDNLLLRNPHYRGLGWAQLRWMFSTFHLGHYQPLSWVTLGLDYLLWGMGPFGYHLTNLILHAVNALLLYFVALRLFRLCSSVSTGEFVLRAAAGFAALLFAVHPLRVESVAWVTERRDVLSGLFFLAAIICYLRAASLGESDSKRWQWMVGAAVVYGLSLLSKASGMTLPVVLAVLDVYPLRRLCGSEGK